MRTKIKKDLGVIEYDFLKLIYEIDKYRNCFLKEIKISDAENTEKALSLLDLSIRHSKVKKSKILYNLKERQKSRKEVLKNINFITALKLIRKKDKFTRKNSYRTLRSLERKGLIKILKDEKSYKDVSLTKKGLKVLEDTKSK